MTDTPDTSREAAERISRMLADDPKSTAFGVRATDLRALLTRAETAEAAAKEWISISRCNYDRTTKAEAERDALQAEVDRLRIQLARSLVFHRGSLADGLNILGGEAAVKAMVAAFDAKLTP